MVWFPNWNDPSPKNKPSISLSKALASVYNTFIYRSFVIKRKPPHQNEVADTMLEVKETSLSVPTAVPTQ